MEELLRTSVDLPWRFRSICLSWTSTRWLAAWFIIVVSFVHAGRADESPTGEPPLRFRVLYTMEDWGGRSLELHTVTVSGRARDLQGKPVAGANVCIVSRNSTRPGDLDPLLARTTTDSDGAFRFCDLELPVLRWRPDPVPKPAQGDFMVFGWRDGFGFTWRTERSYRPEPRPGGIAPGDPDLETTQAATYAGEPLEVDLLLEPPARFHGRILDDQGQPLAHAKVQVGCCDDLRSGWRQSSYCLHLGPAEGRAVNDGLFGAIESLPADLRETRTDPLGGFALNGLRRDTEYQVLIDPGPEFDPVHRTIATRESPAPDPHVQYLGDEAEMNLVIERPRELTVRVAHADNAQPAEGVTIRAHGRNWRRSGTMQSTNAEGLAVLRLPPGPYTLYWDPPGNMDAIAGKSTIDVALEPLTQAMDVKIEAGAVLMVSAVDADTGGPVQGVQFLYETDTSRQQEPLHSQTVFADYPGTNARGELRAVVPPGRRRLVVGQHPADWQPLITEGDLVDLEARCTKTVCFRFSRQAEAAGAEELPNPFGYPPELIAKWDRQRRLQAEATCRLTGWRHFRSHSLSFAKVAEVLNGLDPDTLPDLAAVFRDQLGEELPMVEERITVDGVKRKMEYRQLDSNQGRESVQMFVLNGNEAVQYDSENTQASVHAQKRYSVHVDGIADVCTWPTIMRTSGTAVSTADNRPKLSTTRQDGKLTIDLESESGTLHCLVNETTGFHYLRQWQFSRQGTGLGQWQFAPRVYPNGMVLPACRVEVRVVGEGKCSVTVFVLDKADFYEQLPPDAFAVSVPAGVNVLDWRAAAENGPRQSESGVVCGPVPDVVAHLNSRVATHVRIRPVLSYGRPAPVLRPAKWLNQAGEISPPETKGKVVLIDFWSIGCGPCVAQLPEVQAAAKHFADTDLIVIGLHASRADLEEVAQFAKDKHLEFVLAIDREPSERGWFGAAMQEYGVQGIPATAVIDRAGRLVYLGQLSEALRKVAELLKQG